MDSKELEQKILKLDEQVSHLSQEIASIKSRNKTVEANKAWETCFLRIILITITTYLITSIVFWLIGVPNFLRNALIPTIGYVLSTQSMPRIKDWWLNTKRLNVPSLDDEDEKS